MAEAVPGGVRITPAENGATPPTGSIGAGAASCCSRWCLRVEATPARSRSPCRESRIRRLTVALGGFGYQVTMVGVSAVVWTLIIVMPVVTVRLFQRRAS